LQQFGPQRGAYSCSVCRTIRISAPWHRDTYRRCGLLRGYLLSHRVQTRVALKGRGASKLTYKLTCNTRSGESHTFRRNISPPSSESKSKAVSSIYAAPFSNTCSTQADNNFRKLRLRCRCRCQLPWCALTLRRARNQQNKMAN
jgi:hypothetical protein